MAIRPNRARSGHVTYSVLFRHDGRQTSETFPTAAAAEQFDRHVKQLGPDAALRVLERRQGYLDDTVPTVAQQVTRHIDSLSHLAPGSLIAYRATQRGLAAMPLGQMPIDTVTREDIARWLRGLQDSGRSAATTRNFQALLSSALFRAVNDGQLTVNVAHRHRIRRTVSRTRRFLSYEEFGRLRDAATPLYRPWLTFMVSTGLRFGEGVALRPRDFNLAVLPDPTVTVERAWASGGFAATKTKRGERTLSLPATTVEAIRPLLAGRGADDLVFVNTEGRRIRQSTMYENFQKWCATAGLSGVRIHDLRHTHASWMIGQGMSLFDLQHRLGHESIKTTADTYGHALPEAMAVAARAAGLALAMVPDETPQIEN